MNKSRILSVALTAALVASVAAVSTIGASAAVVSADEVKNHTVGLCGSFDNGGWSTDIPMSDDDGDGIYEGTIAIDSVTEEMLIDNAEGKKTVQFKVRLDGAWDDSWGEYEADYDRTNNSQTNCGVEATVGQPLTVNVKFDTTKADDRAVAANGEIDEVDFYNYWPVTYEVAASAAPADESSTEAPAESSTEAPAESSVEASAESQTSDTTPVQTGDATSAIALAAVVLASLGTAVVMTKKASAKN